MTTPTTRPTAIEARLIKIIEETLTETLEALDEATERNADLGMTETLEAMAELNGKSEALAWVLRMITGPDLPRPKRRVT